jgi:hypothetical protein
MHYCRNQDHFLNNLRQVNEQAGVDKQVVDIIVAFARLKIEHHKTIDFFPNFIPNSDPIILKFLDKNRHITGVLLVFYRPIFMKFINGGFVVS